MITPVHEAQARALEELPTPGPGPGFLTSYPVMFRSIGAKMGADVRRRCTPEQFFLDHVFREGGYHTRVIALYECYAALAGEFAVDETQFYSVLVSFAIANGTTVERFDGRPYLMGHRVRILTD